MPIVDAQIHVWGSGLPSKLAHGQVTAFPTEEAVGLMDEGGVDAAVIHTKMPCSWRQCLTMFTEELPWLSEQDQALIMGQAVCAWWGWDRPT